MDFVPIGSVKALAGNSFFEGESGSFGGNANLEFIPALNLSRKNLI